MEDVQVLKALLTLTRNGLKMSREHANAQDLYGIFDMLRNLAQQRFTSLGREGIANTRINHFFSFYRLCLVGITVECAFDAADLPTKSDLADRLNRLEQDISITLEYFHAHWGE
jgi:hypothetical protein